MPPAAPVINSVTPTGGVQELNITIDGTTTCLSIERDIPGDLAFFNPAYLRGRQGPFSSCYSVTPGSTANYDDWEAPRGKSSAYRARAFDSSNNASPYSSIAAGSALPVPDSSVVIRDPVSGSGMVAILEMPAVGYSAPVPGEIHWALGRADPVITQDAPSIRRNEVPFGTLNRFPTIELDLAFSAYFLTPKRHPGSLSGFLAETFLSLVSAPVRTVLVQLPYMSNSLIGADQFYGRAMQIDWEVMGTGPGMVGSYAPLTRSAPDIRRAKVQFQTVRRPAFP